jgi:hypothetical protein
MDTFVELLGSHRPDRAAEVRARLSGPAPDGVLVVGPDDASVGRLAMALAARLPDRLSAAPADAALRPGWVDRTRAVIWVCHAGTPGTDRHWELLRGLAGAVDEVHLVLAGTEEHRGWAGVLANDHARLAAVVPRLACHPVLPLADGPEQLVKALRRSGAEDPRRAVERNAMRLLRTALDELLTVRESRRHRAELHSLATERALRRHREQLTAHRLDTASEWPKRVRADLTEVRLVLSGEVSAGLRRLREEIRDQLEHADRDGRARFPDRLAAAVARFIEQVAERADELLAEVTNAVRVQAGDRSPVPGRPPGSGVPPLVTGPARRRWEDRAMVAVGVIGSVGLARFAVTGGGAFPAPFGAATLPLIVGVGVGTAYWLARARRSAADRAALARWAADVLGDLRGSVETLLSERVLDAERRLSTLVDRVVARRAAELDSRLREQELLARALVAGLAAHREVDTTALSRLRACCAELDLRLDGPGVASREVA